MVYFCMKIVGNGSEIANWRPRSGLTYLIPGSSYGLRNEDKYPDREERSIHENGICSQVMYHRLDVRDTILRLTAFENNLMDSEIKREDSETQQSKFHSWKDFTMSCSCISIDVAMATPYSFRDRISNLLSK